MIPSPSRKLQSRLALLKRELSTLEDLLIKIDPAWSTNESLKRTKLNLEKLNSEVEMCIKRAFHIYNEGHDENSGADGV